MKFELQVFLILAIIIAAAKIGGDISKRLLKQPIVFGKIVVGLLLGPTLLNIFGWRIFAGQANDLLQGIVQAFAGIGVLFLMFIAGLETDLAQLRSVGKTAFSAAVMGVVLPFAGGILAARFFHLPWTESVFIGAVLTATSVSISAQTLMEIGRLKSREGMTILGAAVIDDIIGIIVLSLVIAFGATHDLGEGITRHASLAEQGGTALANLLGMPATAGILQVAATAVLMGAFFAVAIFLGITVIPRFVEIVDRMHASYAVPAATVVLIFLFAVGAEYLGQVAAITGAYLAGLFLGRTRFAHSLQHGLHPLTYALFVPVFFISIGLGANTRTLASGLWLFAGVIIVVAILAKVIGCALGARMAGFSAMESLRVGTGMISRGEVGMIIAQVGLSAAIIRPDVYATMIFMVLATTIVTPVLLRLTFPHTQDVSVDVYESVTTLETREEEQELL